MNDKIRVKCVSTIISITGCGYSYESSVREYIAVGHVYEAEVVRSDHYRILHDHGGISSEFPAYCFQVTDEPVTINPNRQKEIDVELERSRKMIEEQQRVTDAQRVTDNMDRYYNPTEFYAKQQIKAARTTVLQQCFVGGLSYEAP